MASKFYGNINLTNVKEVADKFKTNEKKIVKTEKYGTQLRLNAKQWEDGNISLSFWDAEEKKAYDLGILFPEKESFEAPADFF